MTIRKNIHAEQKNKLSFTSIEKFHPYKTFLFFALVGSSVLFLAFSSLYFFTVSRSAPPESFVLPKVFSVSTVLLLVSSFSISRVTHAFRKDSFFELKSSLYSTLVLTVAFCLTQILGWKEIFESGYFVSEHVGVAYLYVISGIHFLHVLGGLIYLAVTTVQVHLKSANIASSLMFFSDDYYLTKLQLTQYFWHFIDVLWILLFFMFLFTF
jgi:cytochrome c oxidase subunit 3